MQKRWQIAKQDEAKTLALHEALKINQTLCGILVQRGIDDFNKAKQYFRPQLSDLHSPWLMKDMQKAVDRIMLAFERHEKIMVYGDYDVDGTTAVACLFRYLHTIYDRIDFYIPHRYREGYGISQPGIDLAKEKGFTLIISLDCGIKSVELVEYAQTLGIDFVICDHHLPGPVLPAAAAILNPKQADCPYPYKELCGCGVGFKLMMALSEKLSLPADTYLPYLDLVATAIAADIVPITGENRTLTFYGLRQVNESPNNGIRALMQLAGISKPLSINNLVFVIAPRVNAAGRMDDARKAVQLFIEQDYQTALGYAEMLHNDNADRREADSTITEEALAVIENDEKNLQRKTTVVYQEHWHKGVVGIVASRLIEKYYRPTVVLTRSGDYVAGSARSVAGFNLYEAIYACREYLLGYGGHFAAAGMTLLPENVQPFSEAFEKVVAAQITDDLLIPEIVIDAAIRFSEITPSLYKILEQMEPFGPDNARPVFIARRVTDTGYSRVVKEHHIRFVVKQERISFTGIGFNLASKFHLLQMNAPVDIVFTIDENEWNGEKHLQLKVIDLNLSNPEHH
ncbi:MAG: single-stranded-DNA-specific exonuclease RecJ [Sediminibacterium magnilacihabitans]|jgi:single-stranded-DNA-specific exonuclease|nr:single-stranded-DNA-specific exonuclease RecJ [Sediminibacterium magnilacihabitans]PQV59765.1 exonuclease RecJ [Sediminibacterium magnilacihabitans]